MAHYRKIDVRIWNDQKFTSLTTTGQLTFLFLITHPSMTPIGAMRTTKDGIASELKVFQEGLTEAFNEGFEQLISMGLIEVDAKACCLYIPNFIKYQSAESPNVIRNWSKCLEFIPECTLRTNAIASLGAFVKGMSKGFQKAFAESFVKGMHESVNSKDRAVNTKNPTIQGKKTNRELSEDAKKYAEAEGF